MLLICGSMNGGTSLLGSIISTSPSICFLYEDRMMLTYPERFIGLERELLEQERMLCNKVLFQWFSEKAITEWIEVYKHNPKILFIYRDGRDTILSQIRRGGMGIVWCSDYWNRFIIYSKFIQENYPQITKTIKYEDLITEPEEIIRECCDFIGITYSDELLKFEMIEPYCKKTYGNEIAKDHKELWRTDSEQDLVQKITSRIKDGLVVAGYPDV